MPLNLESAVPFLEHDVRLGLNDKRFQVWGKNTKSSSNLSSKTLQIPKLRILQSYLRYKYLRILKNERKRQKIINIMSVL